MCKIRALGYLFLLAAGIAPASQPSPYAGQQEREIKALSSQDVQDYLQGKGMMLAKAAELNHYPGPLHVLQLSNALQLTHEQKAQTERLRAAMEREAAALGNGVVEKERELDLSFASGTIEPAKLRLLLEEIARLQAELRNVHLQTHLKQKAILTPAQIAAYDELRGYAAGGASQAPRDAHRH